MELRPLGFGEIFDRAITLYVRNFPPLFAIVLVLVVPLAVLYYVIDSSQLGQGDLLVHAIVHPGAALPPPGELFGSPAQIVLLAVFLLVFYLLWPFALDAVAVGVAHLYRGRPVVFGECYRWVLSRWRGIFGMLAIQFGILVAWYVAFFAVLFASVLIAAVFAQAWMPLGVVGFIVAFFVSVGALFALAPIFVALTFAMNAVVIENLAPGAAARAGFQRVFRRDELWRAVLFSLASAAVLVGGSIAIGVVGWVMLLLHAVAIEAVLRALLYAAFAPFSAVLMAVYYFDVRIRREGFDLETELARLAPAASPVA